MYEGIFESACKCGYKDFALGVVPERGAEPPYEDAGVGSDGRLGVRLHPRQVSQEIVVEYALIELRRACYMSTAVDTYERFKRTLSDNKMIALTVASRIIATVSVKPVCYRPR